jgi:hypothetical protein
MYYIIQLLLFVSLATFKNILFIYSIRMAKRSRHHSRKHKGKGRSIINKTMSIAENTSKRYMPKVKSKLENVGENVIKTSKKSIPFLQRMTRKLFSAFSRKKR